MKSSYYDFGFFVILCFLLCACGEGGNSANPNDNRQQTYSPPFSGTIFIAPDLIKDTDRTSFVGLTYTGQSNRVMFDRRTGIYSDYNAHIFVADFDDGVQIEIQVNPEFEMEDARTQAEKYSKVVGQMPHFLRDGLEDVSIHNGNRLFGGITKNILIHTVQGESYIEEGILAETLIHEAVHAVLDDKHSQLEAWRIAQKADPSFISTYAEEHPLREDLAESFVPFLAVQYKSDRISDELYELITKTMPNRIKYFNNMTIEYYPIEINSK